MKLIEKAKIFLVNLVKRIDLENESVTPLQWILVLAVMIVLRLTLISLEDGFSNQDGSFLLAFFFQDLFFFLETLLLAWIWLALFLRVNPKKLFGLMLWGTWLVVLPPIIDLIFYQKIFWSFYLLSNLKLLGIQFVTFFGHLPPAIVYFGTKIGALVAIVITSAFVYFKTKKIWKTILNGVVVYIIFFFMGSFPSWLTFLHHSLAENSSIFSISVPDISGFILSPVDIFGMEFNLVKGVIMFKLNLVFFILSIILGLILWRISSKEKALSFLKMAIKTDYLALNLALFLFGFGIIGLGLYPENFNFTFFACFGLAVMLLGLWSSLVADQLFLKQAERDANKNNLIILLNIIALSGFLLVEVKFFMLALSYKLLLWIIWSGHFSILKDKLTKHILNWIMCILSGALGFMLMSQEQTLNYFPIKLIAWLTLGIVTVFSIKNNETEQHKDEWSDIFSEVIRKIFQEVFIFILFMLGIFAMDKPSLFGWGILLGSISFWAIEKEYKQKKWLIRALFLFYLCLGLINL